MTDHEMERGGGKVYRGSSAQIIRAMLHDEAHEKYSELDRMREMWRDEGIAFGILAIALLAGLGLALALAVLVLS